MQIYFLGTRGEIEPKTKQHRMHTSTLFSYRGTRILIDFGTTWLGKFDKISPKPKHIVLTHAHPDHAEGLKEGTPCPVYATKTTWKLIDSYPIKKKEIISHRKKIRIGNIEIEAFPLLHSLRCPAVGYKITAGSSKVFYAPDVAWIDNMKAAFKGISLYIGDGATITQSMIRKKNDEIFGHANVRQQLTWCRKMGVPKMIVTHCGSAIVKGKAKAIKKIEALADEREVEVEVAYDGMEIRL